MRCKWASQSPIWMVRTICSATRRFSSGVMVGQRAWRSRASFTSCSPLSESFISPVRRGGVKRV